MHGCNASGLIILSEDCLRGLVRCFLTTRSDGAARLRDGRGGNTMSVDALAATLGRGGEGKRNLRGQPCSFLLIFIVLLFFVTAALGLGGGASVADYAPHT